MASVPASVHEQYVTRSHNYTVTWTDKRQDVPHEQQLLQGNCSSSRSNCSSALQQQLLYSASSCTSQKSSSLLTTVNRTLVCTLSRYLVQGTLYICVPVQKAHLSIDAYMIAMIATQLLKVLKCYSTSPPI